MPKCILSGQGRSTFTQELADGRYIRIDSGGLAIVGESIGAGPYTITFNEEEEGDTPSGGITEAEADAKCGDAPRRLHVPAGQALWRGREYISTEKHVYRSNTLSGVL